MIMKVLKNISIGFFVKKESKPTMNVQDRQMLIRFYRDDVEKLGSLLNCKLPWTNF